MTPEDADLRRALQMARLLREACNIWKTEGTGRRGAGERNEEVIEKSNSKTNKTKQTTTKERKKKKWIRGKDSYPLLSLFLNIQT